MVTPESVTASSSSAARTVTDRGTFQLAVVKTRVSCTVVTSLLAV